MWAKHAHLFVATVRATNVGLDARFRRWSQNVFVLDAKAASDAEKDTVSFWLEQPEDEGIVFGTYDEDAEHPHSEENWEVYE